MNGPQRAARILFASGMIGLGILGLIYGDFALQWQPVPTWVPWRQALAYASAVVMLAGGVGLLFARTAALSSRVLFPYLLLWVLLLKLPGVVRAPRVEVNWLGFGEITVLMTGGWVLFATLTGKRVTRTIQLVFGLALLPIGLSHFVYATQTAAFVPPWLPFRLGWAYLTGAGQIAAGLGVLFSVYPRLAATMEGVMLSAFTLLVWIPAIVASPATRLPWTAFLISWAITAAAWVVAASIDL